MSPFNKSSCPLCSRSLIEKDGQFNCPEFVQSHDDGLKRNQYRLLGNETTAILEYKNFFIDYIKGSRILIHSFGRRIEIPFQDELLSEDQINSLIFFS